MPKTLQLPADSPEKMSREADRQALIREAKHLTDEIESERRATVLSEQSKEKINFDWQVYKEKLEEGRTMLRSKIHGLQNVEESHFTQVQDIKQRLKQLLFCFTQESGARKITTEIDFTRLREEHQRREGDLRHDRLVLNKKQKDEETDYAAFFVLLSRSHWDQMQNLKTEFQRKTNEITSIMASAIDDVRTSQDALHEQQIASLQARNKQRVISVLAKHKTEIADLQRYFADIIPGNLETILALKREYTHLSTQDECVKRQINSLAKKNSVVTEPLQGAHNMQERLAKCRQELEGDIRELAALRKELKTFETEFDQLNFANELLHQKLDQSKNVLESRQRATQDHDFNERRTKACILMALTNGIKKLEISTETSDAAFSATVARSDANQNVESSLSHRFKVNQAIAAKDETIANLEAQISYAMHRMKDLNSWVSSQLEQRGLSLDEAAFSS